MDIQSYEIARGIVRSAGYFVSIILILSATYLSFNAIQDGSARNRRLAWYSLYSACGLGLFLLVYLHAQIYVALPMIDPYSGGLIGRFMVPPWVESERVFYWLLMVVLLSAISIRNYPKIRKELSVAVLVLAMFCVLIENPFLEPLPDFHNMYNQYYQALTVGDTAELQRSMQTMYGKMFFFYNSPYMWMHPPLLFLSYAAFTVAFAIQMGARIRSRSRGAMSAVYANIKMGFFVLTAALLLGYPWALLAWKDLPWWWDPKVNSSILMWVLYASYLHTNIYLDQRKFVKLTHVSALLAYAALLFTFFSGYFIPGVHSQ